MELIIIAAGNGKRMGDISIPKVLYPVNGTPNLTRILNQVIESKVIDTVHIVVKDTAKHQFEHYLQENEFNISTNIIAINSGLGDGHAVMSALQNISSLDNRAIVMWGDTYIEYSGTFKELCRRDCTSITFPVVEENNPYVTILTNNDMKVISADFSKLNEKHSHGLHDQSIFMINKTIVLSTLNLMHNVLWKNGKYITESKELNFLHIFHYLWNINDPAICYITEYPTKSFNSIEEVKQIEIN